MRKAFLLILSLILILSACSNNEKPKKTSDGKIKIEYWHVNAETQGGKSVKKLVNNFNKNNKNIYVEEKFNPDMYKGLMQNLQSEAAGGRSPDVVQVGWAFKNYFKDNFQYTSPDKIIQKVSPKDKNFIKNHFDSKILKIAQDDNGKQIGLPYSVSTPVLFINKDIFKQAGLENKYPRTWEDVKKYSEVIKKKTKKYGLFIQEPADSWAQQAMIDSNGSNIVKNNKAHFANKGGYEVYQYMQNMINDKTALHTNDEQGQQNFINGNVGMLFTTVAKQTHISENASFNVTSIEMPKWEGKQRKVPAGGAMLAITAKTEEEKKASWEFMKYLYRVENVSEWTKGTGYVPPTKNVINNPKGLKNYIQKNQMIKPAIKQMNHIEPWASFPDATGLDSEQKLLDMRDQILSEGAPVKKTMNETENSINLEINNNNN